MSNVQITPKDTAEKQAIIAQGKPEIALLVSDIDNTVVDFFGMWGATTDKAFDSLCALHGMTREALEKEVMECTPTESRMHNLPEMIDHVPSFRPKNDEERKYFDKEHAKIVHEWQKGRDDVKLYAGVVQTISKAKAAGAQFVLYSDAPRSSVLHRIAQYGVPADLVDAVYCQPDLDKNDKPVAMPVEGKTAKWMADFEKAGGVLQVLPPGSHKPAPETLDQIRKDRGIESVKNVMMVGDNLKADCGGANALGAFSAWQKDGCAVPQEAIDLYYRIPTNPNYLLGVEKMSQLLSEPAYQPDIVLEKGWVDMQKHIQFVSAEKANAKAREAEKQQAPQQISAAMMKARQMGR